VKVDRQALARFAALRLHAQNQATSVQQGDRRSPFLGRGLEFADYREYDPGDDIRNIDWNVYLRLGQVLVRQFSEERSLSVRICIDTSASMGFGTPRKADRASELAAAIATVALSHRDPVTLCTYGGGQTPLRAKGVNLDGMAELLHLLERVEPAGRSDAYAQVAGQLGTGRSDRLFLLSDLLLEADVRESVLRLMAASSRSPVLVHLLSAEELDPDLDDTSRVIDAETGEAMVIRDTTSAKTEYLAGLKAWLADVDARCKTLGIQVLRPDESITLDDFVHRDLHRAKVVEHAAGGNQ
jgi:uncharacterized protein (DUF58 family)